MAVTFLSTDNDIKQATDDPHKNTLDGTEGRLGQKIECWGQNTAKTLLIAEKGDHEQGEVRQTIAFRKPINGREGWIHPI